MQIRRRKSIRLPEYDYAQEGAYFVTVCVQGRECVLGIVTDENVLPAEIGRLVKQCWLAIPEHFPHVRLDRFVIMPNHIHGIIELEGHVGAGSPRPTVPESDASVDGGRSRGKGADTAPLRGPSLGNIMAYFKYQSTKAINAQRGTPGVRFWQRNYYEHIIRNDTDLYETRRYMEFNPLKWVLDPENPES